MEMNAAFQIHSTQRPYWGNQLDLQLPSIVEIRGWYCNTNHPNIDDLLDEALQIPAPSRSAFLEDRCYGDPELRWRIDRLLKYFGEPPPDDFLDHDKLWDDWSK